MFVTKADDIIVRNIFYCNDDTNDVKFWRQAWSRGQI